MKRVFPVLIIILILISCGSTKKYNAEITKLHSVEALYEDVDKAYKQLKKHHPHLYQFRSKQTLDYKFDSLKAAIKEPIDSRTFYKQLAGVTKYIGQGHLAVIPPRKLYTKKERKVLKKTKFDISNLDFEYLDGKLLVINARGKDSVLVGSEVLKFNNERTQDLIKKYKPLIASDGFNTTLHNRIVGRRFLGYYSNDKGRFDSLALTLKNIDSIYVKRFKRVSKKKALVKKDSTKTTSIKVLKKKLTKVEKKVKKRKRKEKEKRNIKYGYIASRKEYTRNLNFVGKDSTVALLKIRGFSNGKYKNFYKETFTTLDSLKTKQLVIDLRNNGGGRLDEITYLYSFLTDKNHIMMNPSEVNSRIPFLKVFTSKDKPFIMKFFAGLLSPGIAVHNLIKTSKKEGKIYYHFKSSKEQKPNPLNFKGEIYVLINGKSFSASSILSTQLQGNKRATFVGEETGGAYNGTVAGIYKMYELPNTKVKVKVWFMHIDTPFKTTPDGYGIKPTIEILPTIQDRLNKIDPELQWVLKDIEGKK
jgi:C-terminal processing protease CtpA/Prc